MRDEQLRAMYEQMLEKADNLFPPAYARNWLLDLLVMSYKMRPKAYTAYIDEGICE